MFFKNHFEIFSKYFGHSLKEFSTFFQKFLQDLFKDFMKFSQKFLKMSQRVFEIIPILKNCMKFVWKLSQIIIINTKIFFPNFRDYSKTLQFSHWISRNFIEAFFKFDSYHIQNFTIISSEVSQDFFHILYNILQNFSWYYSKFRTF